jgi:outer membrane protein
LLARNDLLKAQLQTSNIELTLLDAESNLTVANENMNLMLGLPENTVIETDSSFVADTKEPKTFIEMENLALQSRKDLQAVGLQKKAATTGIKAAKAEAYPTIALTGGYIAADIPKVLTVTNAVNIGVGVSYNLSSIWKNNTKLAQARARETQVTASEELLNDDIRLQVNKDYQGWLLAQKKIDVYDLLEADVSLLQAKLNAAYARADAALAYNKLLSTTGTL